MELVKKVIKTHILSHIDFFVKKYLNVNRIVS